MQSNKADKCQTFLQLLKQWDYKGITKHLSEMCAECDLLKLKRYGAKQELLFPDRPPKWLILVPAEPEPPEEEVAEGAPVKKRKTVDMPEKVGKDNLEEHLRKLNFDRTITDGLLAYEIRKLRGISEEEARKEVIAMRKAKKLELKKEEEQKMKEELEKTEDGEVSDEDQKPSTSSDVQNTSIVEKAEKGASRRERAEQHLANRPWIPALNAVFPEKERSVMSNEEQKRIVGIIASFLNHRTYRFTGNKEDLKAADVVLADERRRLNEMVIERFSSHNSPPVPLWAHGYMEFRWARRWLAMHNLRFHPQQFISIPWTKLPTTMTNFPLPERGATLNEGRIEKLHIPNLEVKAQLNTHTVRQKYGAEFSNKCPIEEDQDAVEMCLDTDVSFAMDCSTACYLMTDDFLGKLTNAFFSVVVQTKLHKGVTKKIIFISKPKVTGKQRNMTFLRSYAKYAFKTNFVDKRRRDAHEIVTLLTELDSKPKQPQQPQNVPSTSIGIPGEDDMVGSILAGIDATNATTPKYVGPATGKRYTLFNFGSQQALIRSSAPFLCDSPKILDKNTKGANGVSFQTVIELVPTVGAMSLDPVEIAYNKCKMMLKQADAHAIVRIGLDKPFKQYTLQVLQVHPLISFHDKNSVETDYQVTEMLKHGTERMERLFSTLNSLDNGIYLMRDKGDRLWITERDPDMNEGSFHCQKKNKIHTGLQAPPFEEVFHGIDNRFMLQWQIYLGRAPGTFLAADSSAAKSIQNQAIHGGSKKKRRKNKRMQWNKDNVKQELSQNTWTENDSDGSVDSDASEMTIDV